MALRLCCWLVGGPSKFNKEAVLVSRLTDDPLWGGRNKPAIMTTAHCQRQNSDRSGSGCYCPHLWLMPVLLPIHIRQPHARHQKLVKNLALLIIVYRSINQSINQMNWPIGRGPKVKIGRINKILWIQLGLYIRKPGEKSLTQKKLILMRGIALEKNGPCSWENEVKISKKRKMAKNHFSRSYFGS